jgi:hypothetical protein
MDGIFSFSGHCYEYYLSPGLLVEGEGGNSCSYIFGPSSGSHKTIPFKVKVKHYENMNLPQCEREPRTPPQSADRPLM